jgi:hypothetical protein
VSKIRTPSQQQEKEDKLAKRSIERNRLLLKVTALF